MKGIDTNLLIRFLIDDDPRQSTLANRFFATLTKESPGFISTMVLVETYWVLTSAYKISKEACLETFWGLAQSVELEFDDAEGFVEAILAAKRGADFADALINEAARQFQCEQVFTFDKKASSTLGWKTLS